MSASSTIAARCAALSAGIAQIIADASSFACLLRESRNDINAVNTDLLALKLLLDIARGDFAASCPTETFPRPLLYALFDILDCCASATEVLHKHFVKLSAIDSRSEAFHSFKESQLINLRHDLEALRSALDVVLDVDILFFDPASKHTVYPSRKCSLGESDPKATRSLLRRIDIEREHAEALTESRLPVLYASFDKLRACTASILEDSCAFDESQKRSDSRLDSLDLSPSDSCRTGIPIPTELPPAASATEIGAWIANIVHSPTMPPEHIMISDPRTNSRARTREETIPSRGTFYAESTTSGSRTQSSGKQNPRKKKNRLRAGTPQAIAKPPGGKHSKSYTTATVVSSSDTSLIHLNITSDKLAIAHSKRSELTKDQKVAIDWDLRHISRTTSAANVERILWEGANPNTEDPDFGTLFIRVAFELSVDVLNLLLEYGAQPSKTSPHSRYFSPIHAAVLGNQFANVQFLAERGVPIDRPNNSGETPLHLAVRTPGAYPIAKYLLDRGADVDASAKDVASPLHAALSAEELDSRERSLIVQLLLAHGAEGEVSKEAAVRRVKGLSVLGLV